MEGFSKRLARARTESGLTRTELAKKVGVTMASIANWETNDVKEVSASKLIAAAKALNTTAEYLWTGNAPNILSGTPIDLELMETVLEAIEAGLTRIGKRLTPSKKARLITLLYDMYKDDKAIKNVDVERIIRLTA